jgi:hypothetical protein
MGKCRCLSDSGRRPADPSLVDFILYTIFAVIIGSSARPCYTVLFVEIHSSPSDRYAPLTRRDPHLPPNATPSPGEDSRVERRPGGGRRDGERCGGGHWGGLGHRRGVEQ